MYQFAAAVRCQKRTENRVYGITAPFLRKSISICVDNDIAAVIPEQFNRKS